MVVGLGMDLASLKRVARSLERFGDRFIARLLTTKEQERIPSAVGPRVAYMASRFAAKEAAVKALGTGFTLGIGLHDVEVATQPSGKPELRLYGEAARRAEQMGVIAIHLSLSHEREVAGAVVILEGKREDVGALPPPHHKGHDAP